MNLYTYYKNRREYNFPRISFWMSKVDAFGFFILSCVLTGPVWFASYLIEDSIALAYAIAFITIAVAASEKQHKVVAILIVELLFDLMLINLGVYEVGLMVSTAFALTFYRIGKKVYGFFFMCVNYKLTIEITRKNCNSTVYYLELPTEN